MAVDITDPVVFSTVAQTAVLTLTLVIFILSFRTQNNANKEAAYQRVLDDYNDAIRMLVDKPELSKFQNELTRAAMPNADAAGPRSIEDMTARNFVMLLYGLFERTHLLYRKKWIDKETWSQWSAFMELVAKHPMFKEIHQTGEGMWDKPFMDYVSNILDKSSSDSAGHSAS